MLIPTTDSSTIYKLEQLCFERPYSMGIIENIIKSHECFLIKYDNKIVGYMILLISDASYELIRIAIIAEMRNKSIAKSALLEFIKNHKTDIYLEVSEKNLYAIKMYRSIGFKEIDIRYNYYSDSSNAIIMIYKN